MLNLNLQAIIIIAKISFWINKEFLSSVKEASDQYKEKGYIQKLKTNITLDFIDSHHQDLVTSLYRLVKHIDGRYFVIFIQRSWTIYSRVKDSGWYTGDLLFAALSLHWAHICLYICRLLLICLPFLIHAPVLNFLSNVDII